VIRRGQPQELSSGTHYPHLRAEPSVTGLAAHYLLSSDVAAPAASSLAPVAVRAHLGYVDAAIV
jgi:hypothetical protein